jgi:hypothetical protein
VLFSSRPLDEALANALYHAACDVHRRDAPFTEVAGDLLSGRVVNLRKEALLGSIGGPTFEAIGDRTGEDDGALPHHPRRPEPWPG